MRTLNWKTRRVSVTLPMGVYEPLHRFAQRKVWSDSQAVAVLLDTVFRGKSRNFFKALGVEQLLTKKGVERWQEQERRKS